MAGDLCHELEGSASAASRMALTRCQRSRSRGRPVPASLVTADALPKRGRTTEARPLLGAALEWRQSHYDAADARSAEVRGPLAAIEGR
jgi:hypothetical protein